MNAISHYHFATHTERLEFFFRIIPLSPVLLRKVSFYHTEQKLISRDLQNKHHCNCKHYYGFSKRTFISGLFSFSHFNYSHKYALLNHYNFVDIVIAAVKLGRYAFKILKLIRCIMLWQPVILCFNMFAWSLLEIFQSTTSTSLKSSCISERSLLKCSVWKFFFKLGRFFLFMVPSS